VNSLDELMRAPLCVHMLPVIVYRWLEQNPDAWDTTAREVIDALIDDWHGTGFELVDTARRL
jgi:hypothetical protein